MCEYDGSSQFDGAPSQRLATARIRRTRARGVSALCTFWAVKKLRGVRHLRALGLWRKCVRSVRSREVTASQAGGREPPRRAINLTTAIDRSRWRKLRSLDVMPTRVSWSAVGPKNRKISRCLGFSRNVWTDDTYEGRALLRLTPSPDGGVDDVLEHKKKLQNASPPSSSM